jgi:hypothetical protein
MATNDQVVLRTILSKERSRLGPALRDDRLFEIFTAEQILKDFDLSYEEIEVGITGGGNDGGIDSIYAFVNGDLVAEDIDPSVYKKDITIRLFLIQSKTSDSFSGTAVDRFEAFARDLLDLSNDLSDLAAVYDADLLKAIASFRRVYLALSPRYPSLTITFVYASQGDQVHPHVSRKADLLGDSVRKMFPQALFDFQFVGAAELLQLARRRPATSFDLRLVETPTSAGKDGNVGYLCLVRLPDYFRFITTPSGNLNKAMFEANVRDYQGQTEVNEAIASTLVGKPAEDFWWLNNGVTVLASKGSIIGKTLTIQDPQVVNGLQTSTEVFNYLSRKPTEDDDRTVLVRVIVSDDETSRDRIIRATNSQTSIPAASLRATDMIHRNIEDRFAAVGLYYDRRKNFQKNAGRPRDRIITIPYLAQAVTAIVLQQPDDSRARPSSLLKSDDTYKKVFNSKYPIELFLICAETMRSIDGFLRTEVESVFLIARNDIQYHLAMLATYRLLGRPRAKPVELCTLDWRLMDAAFLQRCYEEVVRVFQQLAAEGGGPFDRIAKSPLSTKALQERLALPADRVTP